MSIQEELRKKIKDISDNYKEDLIGGYIVGDGPIPCDILFVGEAPGKTEIEEGKPFVGMAGKNFEKYLTSIGLSKNDIRITNVCYFRPIKIKKGKSGRTTVSNRPPKTSEIELFWHVLDKEIKLVNPKIIVTLGNIPLRRLTSFKSIGECHGALFFNEELKKYIFPIYHPSSLTYNRSEEFHSMYKADWDKLREALEKL